MHDIGAEDLTSDAVLDLYYERGIQYFFSSQYFLAISDFDQILTNVSPYDKDRNALPLSSLWGKALCYACLGYLEEAKQIIYFLHSFTFQCTSCQLKEITPASYNRLAGYRILPAVKFANPDEKITREECVSRVVGCTNKLRSIVNTHVRDRLLWDTFNEYLDKLEILGMNCCNRGPREASTDWVICTTPFIEKLERWKEQMPSNPYRDRDRDRDRGRS